MEKIIAVVVMIAIVVGLIATAVMPTVNQMNSQGNKANQDLTALTASLQPGQVMGATVIANYTINIANIKSTDSNNAITFKINGLTGGDVTYNSGNAVEVSVVKGLVPETSVFAEKITNKSNGNIDTMEYTLVKMN